MKTEKYYFYIDIKDVRDGEEFYKVIEVQSFNNDVDEADRKARTIAIKRGEELAGGYFSENCMPYDIKEHYTIIKCPDNTKIEPYSKQDLFIHDLIEREASMEYEII